jgi:hypothetical protein
VRAGSLPTAARRGWVTTDAIQLTLDSAVACRDLRDRRRLPPGAVRLLAELVRRGLAGDSLLRGAALCVALYPPPPNQQEEDR